MISSLARAGARLAHLTVLTGLLAAVPAGLVHYIGWPLPNHVPSGEELYRFATTGMSDQTLLNAIAILLWLVWAVFSVSVVLEAIAALRGVQAPRLRGLAPVQGLAALLIAGITAGVFAVASPGPLTAAFTAAPAAAAPAAATEVAQPQRTAQTAAVSMTGETIAMTRTAGNVTLVVGDCGYAYQVVKGDSLWRIAKECLGDAQRWPEILKLNQGKYWPHISGHTKLSDPSLIFPGWELTLPADATIPADAEPVHPPAPPAQTPAPSPEASENPSPAPTESVAPTPSATPGGGMAPIATAAPSVSAGAGQSPPPPSAAPTADAPAAEDDSSVYDGPLSGVDLPGGWIPAALGAGLLAAVALVWRRRRHRYRPTPITTSHLDDPDLLPPLAAMTRIRQTLRRSHPELLDTAPAAVPTVAEYASADVKPLLPPTGPTGTDLAGAGQLPTTTGLGLTGDGALDAARGLLIAVLTSGSDDDPDAKGRAVVPAATLAALLGVSAVELGPIARLTVTDTTADGITVLEEEFIRRSRLTAEAQAPTVKALRDNDVHAEPLPQLLLICEHSEPEWDTRLAAIIRLGHSADIGAAIIGGWPAGTTLDVAADGTTGNDQTPRLAVLDPANTIEMLHLLREAHGDIDTTPAGLHTPSLPPATFAEGQPDSENFSDSTEEAKELPESSTPPGAPVTVRILGHPSIIGADGQPCPTRPRKRGMEMLIYLALNRKGVTKSALMEVLYPHATMSRAKDGLSTDLGSLRNALRHAAIASGGNAPAESVINTGGFYYLNPQAVTVDWWTVTDLYSKVAQATDDTARLAHLTAAIAASYGPLAEDLDYEWLDTDREVVRRAQIKLHTHAAALHAADNPHQAWLLLDQACDLDSLSEDLACHAMRAAADTGDADAIRHRLKVLRDALDEAGIDLDQATETLAKDLLRNLQHPRRPE